jgi:sarcosine oxidase
VPVHRQGGRYAHIVLGCGAIGAATAYHVGRRRGGDVLVLEQHTLGHGLGASEDHSRIIRHAYHSTDYTALTGPSYETWARIEELTGLALVHRTGGVDIGVGATGEAQIASYAAALAAAGSTDSGSTSAEKGSSAVCVIRRDRGGEHR